ncbi:ABC transporter ATP-binding protein [Polynucleobacter asymbioticus]|nr:ABC transporter ATP-binding protein [Polynucleobacter asymbioticus]
MGTITVQNLGKAYKQYPTRISRLKEWFIPRFANYEQKWVLHNVTFSIDSGEAIGIIGVNGAGKSTLLKMITRTTQASTGSIEVTGRVSALLELGMGFHPDFTGRQNVRMSGQLLGLSAQEIESVIPEIEAFAGIGDYIDQSVRIYSSGMQVRLAFSVATAVRPDILIIDEAMAVGDAAFQRKCFRRIEEFRELGTTLLLVSHDVESIKKFCTRALYLKNGTIGAIGSAKEVCDLYEKALFGDIAQDVILLEAAPPKSVLNFDPQLKSDCEIAYGDGRALVESIWLEDSFGERANIFCATDRIHLKYQVRFTESISSGVVFAFMIKNKEGIALFGADTAHDEGILNKKFSAGDCVILSFKINNAFASGNYYLNCGVRDDSGDEAAFLHRRVDALIFKVRPDANMFVKSGLINTSLEYSLEML